MSGTNLALSRPENTRPSRRPRYDAYKSPTPSVTGRFRGCGEAPELCESSRGTVCDARSGGAIDPQAGRLPPGVKLFHREVRKVTLTEAGAAYFGRISSALGQISQASSVLKQRRRNELRVSMPPSFARKWFVPRMARFMDLHLEISLQIDASAALADFDSESIDIAVRHLNAQETIYWICHVLESLRTNWPNGESLYHLSLYAIIYALTRGLTSIYQSFRNVEHPTWEVVHIRTKTA